MSFLTNKNAMTENQFKEMRNWIDLLRTTDLPQGQLYLRTIFPEEGYCCLGVFLNMIDSDAWEITPGPVCSWGGQYSVIPDNQKFRLGSPNPSVPEGMYNSQQCFCVSMLNDQASLNFKQIADVLEWAYFDGPQPEFYAPYE